ncbi:unnamed protein product [Brugia timori]|uniref:Orphan protein n=1 Tax=Brugia timori TaxID=42155 RepID=A0A0R3QL87_9BILA|nr:unnamed protein product [Brugia timori]
MFSMQTAISACINLSIEDCKKSLVKVERKVCHCKLFNS